MSLTTVELPGWVEFNAWRTGLRPHPVSISRNGAEVRTVFYLDHRGRIKLPSLACYSPIVFRSERQRASGRTAQWLDISSEIVDEMKRRGVPNLIYFPPEIDDMRPWLWRDFLVGVEYTYSLDLPFDPALADHGHKWNCDRAVKHGMTVERVDEAGPVVGCLAEAAARLGYRLEIRQRELREAQRLMGPDGLRMYACFDRGGQAAAACVVVHAPGNRALLWLTGTKTDRLSDGSGHLLWRSVFDELASSGATGIDMGGPNSPAIATYKSRWGSRLLPIYSVRSYSPRAQARFVLQWLSSRGPGRLATESPRSTVSPPSGPDASLPSGEQPSPEGH